MAQRLSTSVSFDLNEEAGSGQQGDRYIMEESARQPILPTGPSIGEPVKYFRVHPTSSTLRLEPNTGDVALHTSQMSKITYEVVSFNNTKLVELRYPNPTNVEIDIIGSIIPADGTGQVVTVSYDAAKRAVVASRLCYGSVKVKYKAPYDLWLAKFELVVLDPLRMPPPLLPFQGSAPNPDDEKPNYSNPMVILAYRRQPLAEQDPNEVVASLTLQPPEGTNESGESPTQGTAYADSDAHYPELRMLIDPDHPPRLIPPSPGKVLEASVRVWVIPAVQPETKTTSGQIVSWSDGASGFSILETITYSNTPSGSMKYQPAGSVNVEAIATFVDKWGRRFTPRIAKPGEQVCVVNWVNANEFNSPRMRTVLESEIVICDEGGNTIPCYGVVKAEYSVVYNSFELRFDYDENLQLFKTAFVLARTQNGQAATIRLDPPLLGGVK